MRRRNVVSVMLVFPLVAFLCVTLLYPFALMVAESFHPPEGLLDATSAQFRADKPLEEIKKERAGLLYLLRNFTLVNYLEILRTPSYRQSVIASLILCSSVSIISIPLCMGPAWLLVRREFFGKRLFRTLLTIPMSFSGVIVGFLAVVMIGKLGAIPEIARFLAGIPFLSGWAYSLTGLVLAYIYWQIPRATLSLESAIRKFDWDLEDAARSLGASNWQLLRYVMLPLLTPAVISTFALNFAIAMGSFGVALILLKKLSILPLEVFLQMIATLGFEIAAAMSVVLSIITVATNLFLRRFAEEHYAFQREG